MAQININQKRCKSCGLCIAFCPRQVFTASSQGEPVVDNPEQCSKCYLCVMRCPDFALEVEVSQR